jgi:hypothetical protein
MIEISLLTRFDASMVFNLTHLRIYGGKVISRHFQLVRISYKNWIFMELVIFPLFSSSIISMLGSTDKEPWIQKDYLGFLLTVPTKKHHNISISLFRNLFFVRVYFENFQFHMWYNILMQLLLSLIG